MTRVLVTGGAGFIGHHLVRRLLADGYDVTVLDDFSTGVRERLDQRVNLIVGTVCDRDACWEAMLHVDVVFHLAALTSVPESFMRPTAYSAVNTNGTLNLLSIAKLRIAGARFVFASSAAVPGLASPYAVSKLAAERYVELAGISAAALRFFNVYGAEQGEHGVIARMIAAARNGAPPTIYGDGHQTRDFVHVDDVVEALIAAGLRVPATHLPLQCDIGTGTAYSIRRLWDLLCVLTPDARQPSYEPALRGDVHDSIADTEPASVVLGWRAHVDLPAGLKALLA